MNVGSQTKLLIITTSAVTIKAFLLPDASFFRSKGWRVDAMASGISNCDSCKDSFNNVYDISWSRNPIHPYNFLHAIAQVKSTVVNGCYDIVHVHTPIAAFLTRFALRNVRCKGKPKIIYTAHGFHFHSGGGFLKNNIFLAIERLAGKWTDYLVVINHEDEQAARSLEVIEARRLCYMPGIGVDTSHYSPDKVSVSDIERIRSELHLAPVDKLFLMIAEFNPGKRHIEALRALQKLNRSDVHLAFAGTGPLMARVKQYSQEMGLKNHVHFLGLRNDIRELITSSIAVLLPSEREGLPRSIMEALCLGVPVVGYDIRGVRDLLTEGCGILVPLGNIDAFSEAMRYLMEHTTEALEMGARGKNKMQIYDIKQILALHENLYSAALNDSSSNNT